MSSSKLWILSFLCISLLACHKKTPIEPVISYKGVSKTFMGQNRQDSMILEFGFTDGDGDLGAEGEDMIFVRDSRDSSLIGSYQIPAALIYTKEKCREGSISLVVYAPCCVFANGSSCQPNSSEPLNTMRCLVQMRDRAGHWSNIVETEQIELDCTR